jgi:hypothetical protein
MGQNQSTFRTSFLSGGSKGDSVSCLFQLLKVAPFISFFIPVAKHLRKIT